MRFKETRTRKSYCTKQIWLSSNWLISSSLIKKILLQSESLSFENDWDKCFLKPHFPATHWKRSSFTNFVFYFIYKIWIKCYMPTKKIIYFPLYSSHSLLSDMMKIHSYLENYNNILKDLVLHGLVHYYIILLCRLFYMPVQPHDAWRKPDLLTHFDAKVLRGFLPKNERQIKSVEEWPPLCVHINKLRKNPSVGSQIVFYHPKSLFFVCFFRAFFV